MYKIASDDSARGDSDGSSQRNSNEDEDDALVLGLTNNPTPRSPTYEPRSPMDEPVIITNTPTPRNQTYERRSPMNEPIIYTSDKRTPFNPGPNTADLKKHSYFPSKEELPGYLPSPRSTLQRQDSGSRHGGPPSASGNSPRRPLRKQQSTPEFRNIPDYRSRIHDEGYTSMGRGDYPPGYFDNDPYPPPMNPPLKRGPYSPPLSPLSSDVDLSQTVPAPRTNQRRGGGSRDKMSGSRDKMYRGNENDPMGAAYGPPVDYQSRKRNAMLKRTNSGYY